MVVGEMVSSIFFRSTRHSQETYPPKQVDVGKIRSRSTTVILEKNNSELLKVKGDSRDSQGHGDPLMVSFPYYSHIFRDSYGSGMGIVWGPSGPIFGVSRKQIPLINVTGSKRPQKLVKPLGSNHLLRMVMEPKYLAEEVIIHPNHHLTMWLDP